ncbi:MAG: hypothetical protein J0H48_10745 [Nitrosospira multiformis]|nr:hypothetical protein [Nitrosospira multiformis]
MEKLRITLATGIGTTVIILLLVSTVSAIEAVNEPAAPRAAKDQERHFTIACEMPGDTANFSWVEGNLATALYYNNQCSHPVKVTAHLGDLADFTKCLTVKAGMKDKRVYRLSQNGKLYRLTRGC